MAERPRRTRHRMGDPRVGKPRWLRMRPRSGPAYHELKRLVAQQGLNTICEEGRCPNIGECWSARTATFMVLGDRCTRKCTFCNVGYGWSGQVDRDEPRRLAEGLAALDLGHAVITSVDRDDLGDGGAAIFVECVQRLREACPGMAVELLVPDFRGKDGALEAVLDAAPDVLAHNLETVPRLYPGVRPRANYAHSLGVLARSAVHEPRPVVKTGIMVGLGEEADEVAELMGHCVEAGVDVLTIGQYLQPTVKHHRVERFWEPEEFAQLAERGRELGLRHVEAGPLVRSSYHAERQLDGAGEGLAARR